MAGISQAKALNALVHGRKKWAAYPPGSGEFSTAAPSVAFGQASFQGAWECTQVGGDIVFIPGAWSHATLNIEESIGFTQLLSHRAMDHAFQMPDDEPDVLSL